MCDHGLILWLERLYLEESMDIKKWCREKFDYCAPKLKKDVTSYKALVMDKNLMVRVCTSGVVGVVFLGGLFSGGIIFHLLLFSLLMVSSFEWCCMTSGNRLLYIPAAFILALPYASLAYIYNMQHGTIILMWLIFSVWITDTAAYFFGKTFGKRKILPTLSPNKTWIGLWGGAACSAVATFVMSVIFGIFFVADSFVIGAVIALLVQIGDFTESGIKRLCDVKDSGFVLPGHGGVMDRMDGFIFAAPVVACYIKSFSKFFSV